MKVRNVIASIVALHSISETCLKNILQVSLSFIFVSNLVSHNCIQTYLFNQMTYLYSENTLVLIYVSVSASVIVRIRDTLDVLE